MKQITIINGHPDPESFCSSLAESYKQGAEQSGAICKLVNLSELEFNPVLKYGYRKRTELEPDLLNVLNEIKNSEHLVFVYPTWWGTYPALLKGFIDRLFLPGLTYQPRSSSLFQDKLLRGKTARLIVTMDAPSWYYKLFYGRPGHNSMKKVVLNYCGVKPVRITELNMVKSSTEKRRNQWIQKIEKLGQHLN